MRAHGGTRHSRLSGLGAFRPARVVTNADIVGALDSTEEWIVSRSGIRTRRFAGPDETVAEMAVVAGGKALSEAGVPPDRVSLVIVATMTHLRQTPPLAPEVADRLGATAAGAFDLSAACAGFCYGLSVAAGMVATGTAEHVLVVGVERMSDVLDPTDRSTAFLFGDGAGAVVVSPSDEPGIGPTVFGADGSLAGTLGQDHPWDLPGRDPSGLVPALRMVGPTVFRWSVTTLPPIARDVLAAAGVRADELGAFVPHQANRRIIDALVRALDLPEHVAVAREITTMGNTSAASVPLAMEQLRSAGAVRSGELALLLGFGSGLTYAGQVVRLP